METLPNRFKVLARKKHYDYWRQFFNPEYHGMTYFGGDLEMGCYFAIYVGASEYKTISVKDFERLVYNPWKEANQ
jgi:hypothetical protein